MKHPRRTAVWSIAILALLCAMCAVAADRPALKAGMPKARVLKAGVFEPPRAAPELSLQASNGGRLSLARYRGFG